MKTKPSPYFPKLIDHIDQSWLRIKSMHYPFSGRDFKELKGFSRSFQEWGLMALWDAFVGSDSDWVRKSGYSISAFIKCLPWLVDDRGWKSAAAAYQGKMVEPIPLEIAGLFGSVKLAEKECIIPDGKPDERKMSA